MSESADRQSRRGLLAAFLGLCGTAAVTPVHSFDVFWYLRAAEEILARGGLPPVDTLSFTAHGLPWLDHEWLTQLLFLGLYRIGGFAALSILSGACLAAVIGLVWWGAADGEAVGEGSPGGAPATAFVALGALAAVLRDALAVPRAQLLSDVLFAATLAICARDVRRPSRRLLAVLPLAVLWTNLHGGNPTGATLCGLLFLARPSRVRAAVAAGAALATMAGPYGPEVHRHFLGSRQALPLVREWMPLADALGAGAVPQWIFVALLVAGVAAVAVRARCGEPVRFQALALIVFGALAVRWVRFSLEASMVAALCLAPLGSRWAASRGRLAPGASAIAGLALVAVATLATPPRPGIGLDHRRIPVAAVAHLRAHRPPGPMFNGYNYGSYLLWAYRDEKVFIDGRAFTLYPNEHITGLVAVYDRPERFRELEARWGFRLAVLQRQGRGAGLDRWLRAQSDWQIAFEDPGTTVLTKRE